MTPPPDTGSPAKPTKPSPAAPDPAPRDVPPLQPRRKLLAVLSILMALWIAALIGMYVKWVWPEHRAADAAPTTRLTD